MVYDLVLLESSQTDAEHQRCQHKLLGILWKFH
jgi:hypothetical protein